MLGGDNWEENQLWLEYWIQNQMQEKAKTWEPDLGLGWVWDQMKVRENCRGEPGRPDRLCLGRKHIWCMSPFVIWEYSCICLAKKKKMLRSHHPETISQQDCNKTTPEAKHKLFCLSSSPAERPAGATQVSLGPAFQLCSYPVPKVVPASLPLRSSLLFVNPNVLLTWYAK